MTRVEGDWRRHRRPKVQCQALPAVYATVSRMSPEEDSRNKSTRKLQRIGAVNSTENENLCEHPMDVFEDILDAVDEFLGVSTSREAAASATYSGPKPHLLPCDNSHLDTTSKDTSKITSRKVSRTKSVLFSKTRKGENSQLPRLRLTPSDDDTDARRTAKRGTHLQSTSKRKYYHAPLISSRASSTTHDVPCRPQGKLLLVDGLDDDPFDLMLRCKEQARPEAHKRTTTFFYTSEGTLDDDPSPEADRRKLVAVAERNDAKGDLADCISAPAGVFRISHPGTGFVHYGYTWDIAGAKAHQLRLLRGDTGTREVHPHRGLSTVLRGQYSPARRRCEERKIRFEVVRRMSLPPRFRAGEFEQTLREACSRELAARRSWLLVLIARHFRRKHFSPAFQRILAVCQHLAEVEAEAAVEVQRTWRGYFGRTTARLERKQQDLKRTKRLAVVIWAQARYRGRKGRLLAAEERTNVAIAAEGAEFPRCSEAAAATKVQRWLRSSSRRRRKATTKSGGDAAAGNVASGTTYVDPEVPLEDATGVFQLEEIAKDLSRPISASELMVPEDLCSTDNLCSHQFVPDEHCPPLRSLTQEGSEIRNKGHGQHRAPSLAEGTSGSSSTAVEGELCHSLTMGGSAALPTGATTDTTLELPISHIEKTEVVTSKALGALQLVLEEATLFTSARAIQALWRGFIVRLGVRKRRKIAAALREKREGKWRQQRGVVGKQVAVGWDDRRELEGGMRRHGVDTNKGVRSPYVGIQSVWRGALSRMRSRAARKGQRDKQEASLTIQRVLRGERGRRRAREEGYIRDSRITAAQILTTHARRFVERTGARRRRRHLCAITFQRAVRRFAARRKAYLCRVSRREYAAARKVQSAARLWLGGRQARQRTLLQKMGACALCCKKLVDVFFEATEQELCLECYRQTSTLLDDRGIVALRAQHALEILAYRRRDRATTLVQRAWLRFQQRTCRKYGTCEVCARLKRSGIDLFRRPRAARAVCLSGCDRRRRLKYCRRCCAIVHSLRATSGHEIRSMDRYGVEITAATTLSGIMWRYNLKRRFWRVFTARRQALNSHATSIQSRWRCHRCRSVFYAVRKAFLCLEATAKSVERYWSVVEFKDVLIPAIAGFLAHSVDSSPPGVYPIPSGHEAVWETGISDIVRCRAVENIQRRWRKRMLRVEAKTFVDVARLKMMEYKQQCALAELRAATDIERVWRGHRGRIRTRRRAATVVFARETAEQYVNPSAFTIENLRAFNAHGGFLGRAGLDARSLLAVSAGDETLRSASYCPRRVTKPREGCVFGPGTISLGLDCHEGDGGLASAVVGITELALRVCLRRCDTDVHKESGRELAPSVQSIPWIEREREQFCEHNALLRHRGDGELRGPIDVEDEPPLTLKLELISVQVSRGVPYDTQSSDAQLRREKQSLEGGAHPFIDYEDFEHRRLSRESCPSDASDPKADAVASKRASGTGAGFSGGSFTEESSPPRGSSAAIRKSIGSGDKDAEKRSWDRRNTPHNFQYQCEVLWCGQSVGGTRTPLRGFPVPQWEGQVFYLPLWAAGVGTSTVSILARNALRKAYSGGKPGGKDWQGTHEGFSHRLDINQMGGDTSRSHLPPLLKVTLNELTKGSLRGHGGRPCKEASPWMSFLSGLKEPVPVGRVILEAGDVLGMLGSQQLVDMPVISSPRRVHHGGAPDKNDGDGSEDRGKDRRCWQLRLLLSLEGRERTRTRLMVTEVVMSTIAEIIDLVPGRVARIELRVVGTRALVAAASSSSVSRGQISKLRQIPVLPVNIEWAGEHAGVVELLPLEGEAIEPSEEAMLDTQDGGFDDPSTKSIGNGVVVRGKRIANKKLPRQFMLPMDVPSIMGATPTSGSYSSGPWDARFEAIGDDIERGCRRWGGDGLRVVEGRSHCLRVKVGKYEAGISRDSLALRGESDDSEGAFFYERDLIRDDWTELLVPISTTSCSDQVAAAPETAVVLQARSAGFHPKVPPMWLVHRDFAERIVRRIVTAALAAVTQPRVEVTLVGLLGDIDSLLLVEDSCGEFDDQIGVSSRGHSLPAVVGTGRERGDDNEEVICQAFWNGTLANELRFRRLNHFPPEHAQAFVAAATHLLPRRKTASRPEFQTNDHHDTAAGMRQARIPSLLTEGNGRAGRDKRAIVDSDLERREHPVLDDRDPATLFFNGQASNESCFHDRWMKLGDASSSPRQSLSAEEGRGQVEHGLTSTYVGLKELENRSRLPSTSVTEADGARKITTPAFTWVPVETERYAERPFRFFLPTCFSGSAGIVKDPGNVCRHSGDGDGRHHRGDRNDADREEQKPHGKSTRADGVISGRAAAERLSTVTGNLSLVFWAVSPATADNNAECIDAKKKPGRKFKGRKSGVIEQFHQPSKAPREQACHLIGFAQLANDELVLQPPGKQVELPLLRDAGLDSSTARAVMHEHKREVDTYRVTPVSVAIAMRHFDVPRGPILNLRCPAPFLEVEIIDGHRLNKARGWLSTNPYVVLTLNGEPFARSTTCRGTTYPLWLSETFRVRLPPPPPGAWHLTVQDYFRRISKRSTPFILGAEVYNDVERRSSRQKSRAGIGDSNTLLGQGHVPFSQLKSLPYHYIPICLSTPSGGCFPTPTPFSGGGGTGNHASPDAGLLGIGLRILFPDLAVPDPPACTSYPVDTTDSSLLPSNEGVPEGGAHPPDRACHRDEILLRVHEAENLIDDTGAKKRSLNPYCAILVEGIEVGRTRTIPDSANPLWATMFYLSDELLLERSPLNSRSWARRSGERTASTVKNNDPCSVTAQEVVVSRVDLEVWNRTAQGQPVFMGSAELPTEFMRELLVCDGTTVSDAPLGGHCSVAASGSWLGNRVHSLKLRLRPREDRWDGSPGGGSNFATPAAVSTAGKLEANGLGILSVSVEKVKTATAKTTGAAKGVVAWGPEKGNGASGEERDNKFSAYLEAADSGRLTRIGSVVGKKTASKDSLEAYRTYRQQALAETSRGARAGLEEARAMVRDAWSASMSGRLNNRSRDNEERFLLAWKREKSRAERAETFAARRSSKFLRQERLEMLAIRTKRNVRRPRSTDSLRRRRRTEHDDAAKKAIRGRREERRARRRDARPSGGRIEASPLDPQETSAVGVLSIDRGATGLTAPKGGLDGEPTIAKKTYSSQQNKDEERSPYRFEAEHEQDGRDIEEDSQAPPPTVLERILPPLPAARRELFLDIQAFSGLSRPFNARGSPVLAKVFWGQQEVACTRNATDVSQETLAALGDNTGNSVEDGGLRDLMGAVVSAAESALALAAGGGTAAGRWEGETFRLPLPYAGLSGEDGTDETDIEEDDAKFKATEKPLAALDAEENDHSDNGGDGENDLHLRIEVWQGRHCHGQVEFDGSELMHMCKKVQNASPGGRADFEIDCGNGDVRLPDHFPHFLPAPEALIPHKVPLVPRDGETNRWDSDPRAQPARLALVLLLLEPGQGVAAQGQLAVAFEERGTRTLRLCERFEASRARRRHSPRSEKDNHRCNLAEATGIAESLTNVLVARRSPLSFRVELLALYAETGREGKKRAFPGWWSESRLFLVARREETVISRTSGSRSRASNRMGPDTDQRAGDAKYSTLQTECSGENRNGSSAELSTVEELGRSLLFTMRSAITILPCWWFIVPPSFLVADLRRRGQSNDGGSRTSAISKRYDGETPESRSESRTARVVLELVAVGGDSNEGSFLGDVASFWRRTKEGLGSAPGADGVGKGAVVARAILDPRFLRQSIGRQRSVEMKVNTSKGAGRGGHSKQKEDRGKVPRSIRLNLAGHTVSARLGSPRLRLQVLECQNLRRADVLGKSDPCVFVYWDGKGIGRTPVVREDMHPAFPGEGSIFRLPLSPSRRSQENNNPPEGGAFADWAAYVPELRLEVWDMDRDTFSRKWKRGECLGTVTLRGPRGLAPILEASIDGSWGPVSAAAKARGVMLKLRPKSRRSKRASGSIARPEFKSGGLISVKLALENDTDDAEEWLFRATATPPSASLRGYTSSRISSTRVDTAACISSALQAPNEKLVNSRRQLQVRCLDARGLPLGCDAYCRVYWNGRQVGRTATASMFAEAFVEASGQPTPARSFQRNPVWWTQSSSISAQDGHNGRKHPVETCVTGCVPLYEASEGDELTVEIFDANEGGFSRGNKAVVHGESAIRHFVAGNGVDRTSSDDAKVNPSKDATCSHEDTKHRDMAGTSLGTVTIRGNNLVNPLRGRIDLPVLSTRQENVKTLSISLEFLPTDETMATVPDAFPLRMVQQSKNQQQHPKHWLRLLLIEACILRGLDLSGTSDPFCVVYVDQIWHSDSHACCGTLTPRWDHSLEFEIFRPGSAAADFGWGNEVRVEVWDVGRVGADNFIGEIRLSIRENPQGEVEISSGTRCRPTQQEAGQGAPRTSITHRSHGSAGGDLERHLLRLCREGEREAPPDDEGSIGTLLCATQVFTEQNWSKEVESMRLPWSLGVGGRFSAGKANLVVVQLVGIVPEDGTTFPVPPDASKARACFALLRWNGAVVGRTPDCRELHEPTWYDQTFALRSRKSVSDEVLEIELYFSKEDGKTASSDVSASPQTTDLIVARCRIEGPFYRERFSQYASTYPLLHESKPSPLGELTMKKSGREKAIPESGEVVGAMNLRIAVVPTDVAGAEHTSAMGERVIGDKDPPEIRRRRTNKVERRLRLWIRWISLAHLVRPVNGTFRGGKKAVESRVKGGADTGADGCSTQAQANNAERDERLTAVTHNTPESTRSSPSLLSSISGVSCRVVWCGELAAVFRLCPRTGLPLTPGECLLPLPRGMSWRSCSLVLEVITTEKYADESGARTEERERDDGTDCDKKHMPQCSPRAGERYNPLNVNNQGQDRLLGSVMVGWQALMSLQEQACRFTTCPEEAVPEHDAPRQERQSDSGGRQRLSLVCSLCIPTTNSKRSSLPGADGGTAQDCWRQQDVSMPQVIDETEAIQSTERDCVCCCGTWRVLPARLALSMTLERLSASRPPRPTRAPPAALMGSLCRLRVGLVGRGASVRASHPDFSLPERFLPPGTVIFVGWNGRSDTVGSLSEWQFQLCSRDDGMTSDVNDDIILPVPPRGRERLLLSLFLKKPAGSTSDLSQGRAAVPGVEMVTLGQASVDWEGLSCLPRHATNYFVDTMDGRSSTNENLLRGMSVDLELVAPTTSTAISPPAHSSGETPLSAMNPICARSDEDPRRALAAAADDDAETANQQRSRLVSDCRITAGVSLRVSLRLEESPAFVPHELSLMPVAAGGPGSCIFTFPIVGARAASSGLAVPDSAMSPGDFRDPCRRERVPYLRFSWLWDDRWLSLVERRTSLVPPRVWRLGARRAIAWPRTTVRLPDGCMARTGHVAIRLPLVLSGIDGYVSWPGCVQLRGDQLQSTPSLSLEDEVHRECGELIGWDQRRLLGSPVLFVQAYDMGKYTPLEHRAARTIQSLWRRAVGVLKRARLWWEWGAEVRRHAAAMRMQANYRGWKARKCARAARQETEQMSAGATVIQRAWRVAHLRTACDLHDVVNLLKLERDRKARCRDVRQSKLFLLVARGTRLRGMDLSGLSDPFCVILWNNEEIGRTAVRYSTRDPDWVGDESIDSVSGSGESADAEGCFELPFIVPDVEAWGDGAWPPMRLEIRCYDHDLIGSPELIGRVLLDTDDSLAMYAVSDTRSSGYSKCRFGATDFPATLTWLELQADVDNMSSGDEKIDLPSSARSSVLGRYREDRNPFDSLGDIALALASKIPLQASLGEYQRSIQNGGFDTPRGIADAGVRAVIRAAERELASRDRGLWVVNASGLWKGDFFGKSDPYAKVFWDGREIGKTVVCRKTLNPVWFTQGGKKNTREVDTGRRKQTKKEQPYFWLEGAASINPLLRVEVYDWDAVGWHDFLGGVELDLSEVVELQRITLAKARTHGGSAGQQMFLKTEYQLRSRDNQIGNNGTVGLCVYLDLEQEKQRARRNQVIAARKQQALDLEIAKADARKGAEECKSMAMEDTDAPDDSQHDSVPHQQQQQGTLSPWQVFYDDTAEPPVPWWYNSVTGESTWECPTNREQGEEAKEKGALFSTTTEEDAISLWQVFYDNTVKPPIPWWYNSVTGESTWECPNNGKQGEETEETGGLFSTPTADDSQDRHQDLVIVENGVDERAKQGGWQLFYDSESFPGEPTPWWFNSATGESTWECPVAMPASEELFKRTAPDEQQGLLVGGKGTIVDRGVSQSVVGANSTSGAILLSQWTRHWNEEHQAFYFFNEVTQESTWEDPDSAMPAAEGPSVQDTESYRDNTRTPNAMPGNDLCTFAVEDGGRIRSAPNVHQIVVADIDRADGVQGTALGANLNDNALPSTLFPFFVNERGNRVFAVPRSAARRPP